MCVSPGFIKHNAFKMRLVRPPFLDLIPNWLRRHPPVVGRLVLAPRSGLLGLRTEEPSSSVPGSGTALAPRDPRDRTSLDTPTGRTPVQFTCEPGRLRGARHLGGVRGCIDGLGFAERRLLCWAPLEGPPRSQELSAH